MTVCSTCGAACPEGGDCPSCGRPTLPTRKNGPLPVRASASPVGDPASIGGLPGDPEDLSGTVLGSYRLLQQIGVGGIGYVYRAEHVRLARQVAIKRLRPEYAAHPSVVARFFAEARAANQIAHENIVEITDFVEDDPAGTYLIMELLKGFDLGQLLEREPILPLDRSVRILVQATRALCAAHAEGIVHRDLKPDNIFLTERAGVQDFVKLLDFGVAKLTQQSLDDPAAVHRTAAGSVLGTPAYMAPEQARGQPTDHRIDIYAMGVIMYELTTGVLPFTGSSLGELIVKHTTTKPERPSKVKGLPHKIPDALEKLILRCLEKSPADRPATMADIEAELVAIATDEGWPLEVFSGTVSSTLVRGKPRAWPLALAFLTFAAGVGALAWVVTKHATLHPVAAARAHAPATGAAALPRHVRLRFESTPTGSEVWRAGDDHPLGITPFELSARRRDATAPAEYEFRHAGYATLALQIPLVEDRIAIASLGRIDDAVGTTTSTIGGGSGTSGSRRDRYHHSRPDQPEPEVVDPATTEIDRNAVIDPFDMRPSAPAPSHPP